MGPQNDWARRTAALVGGECAELLAAPQTPPARAAAYRMLRAARNLELWATLAGGGAPARVMDLAASARALLEAAREVWPLPPALLHVSVCSQPLPVAASEPAFGAVLLNLLCNSLVHGGAKPAVSVRVVRQGSRGVLLVRDWGPGIPHHRQRQALAPFSGAVLNSFVKGLSHRDRVLFLGRYWYGSSYKELALKLGITENNAAVRLSRLRDKLRAHMQKKGVLE